MNGSGLGFFISHIEKSGFENARTARFDAMAVLIVLEERFASPPEGRFSGDIKLFL